jgi:hypothetical protein
MVIFFVLFKMLGKVSNSFGKNSDLNFGGTGVGFVKSVSNDYFGFFFLSHHSDSPQKNFLLFGFFAGKGELAFEATATGRFKIAFSGQTLFREKVKLPTKVSLKIISDKIAFVKPFLKVFYKYFSFINNSYPQQKLLSIFRQFFQIQSRRCRLHKHCFDKCKLLQSFCPPF